MKQIWVIDISKKEFDEGREVKLTDKEFQYIKDLICQQNDSHELVYQITKKLGCYLPNSIELDTQKCVTKED
jgi:hypothetical protein